MEHAIDCTQEAGKGRSLLLESLCLDPLQDYHEPLQGVKIKPKPDTGSVDPDQLSVSPFILS
jgi:hypothetical protein